MARAHHSYALLAMTILLPANWQVVHAQISRLKTHLDAVIVTEPQAGRDAYGSGDD